MSISNIPKNIEDVLFLQERLDEMVQQPRKNGFIPGERTREKINFSIIAECVELNEEMEGHTHKTWKQKEFNKEKVLEELTDILFFIAQVLNQLDTKFRKKILIQGKKQIKYSLGESLKPKSKFEFDIKNEEERKNGRILKLIHAAANSYVGSYLDDYIILVFSLDYTMEDIYKEYYRKWQINTTRIAGEWTNG